MERKRVVAGASIAASSAAAALLFRRYMLHEVAPPELVFGDSDERGKEIDQLLFNMKALLRDYRPHPVFEFSGIFGTMLMGAGQELVELDEALGGLLTRSGLLQEAPGRYEELVLSDGGTVSLHWSPPPEEATTREMARSRVVLLLPGLNNHSKTPYLQAMLRHLRQRGFQGAILNYRGIGGTPLTTQRCGCADAWMDLPQVLDHMEATLPGADFYAVGYSMGGAILLRHLGDVGEECRLKGAVTIAAPFNFHLVRQFLESTLLNRAFGFAMTVGAAANVRKMMRKYPELATKIDMDLFGRARRVHDIDKAVVARLNGYADAEDYYDNVSPHSHLHRIAARTLILHAEDDPVINIDSIPWQEVRKNPNLIAAVTRRGGHIAWTGSRQADGASWVDRMAARFFEATSGYAAPRQKQASRLLTLASKL